MKKGAGPKPPGRPAKTQPRDEKGGALFPLLLILVFIAAATLGYIYNPFNLGSMDKGGAFSGGGVTVPDATPTPSALSVISPERKGQSYPPQNAGGSPRDRDTTPSFTPFSTSLPTPEDKAGIPVKRDMAGNEAGEDGGGGGGGRDGAKQGSSFRPHSSYAELEAEKGMYVKEGGHFNVKFDGGENAVAGHLIALVLEEAYIKVGSDMGFYPDDRIEAVLYTREQFRDVTRSPAWAGAIYDGRIKIPAGGVAEKTELLEKVLFHEYTHALVHRISKGRAPTWLNEGIAQHEEGKDDSVFREALREFARGKKLSLRRFEGSFMRLDRREAELAYAVSLSATAYIIREFGIFSVTRILEGLANGMPLDNSIRSAVYLSYEDLERAWLEYLSKD